MLEIVSGIDGDRFFDKIGKTRTISIFRAIFGKRGDLGMDSPEIGPFSVSFLLFYTYTVSDVKI